MRRTALTALVALLVVLAGCGATTQGNPTTTATTSTTADDTALQPSSGSTGGPTGTIAFYVSDQPAAIEDFEHLNVTITEIGLKPKATDDDSEPEVETEDEEDETDGDENETDDDNSTSTTTVSADVNATNTSATNTTTTNTTATTTTEEDPEADSEDEEEAEPEAEDEDDDENEKAGWVTYQVDDRTVDLTELKGANATRLANLAAPNGTYTTVFVYVSEVNGTLKNGESVNVKLPSQKLQLHTTFTIGPDSETAFVYDIAVHKAGNSGKYILKPNIAESGTEVEIEDIDEKGEMESENNEHGEGMDDDDENESEMGEDMGEEMDDDENETEMGEGMDGDAMDDDENESEMGNGQGMADGNDDDGEDSEAALAIAVEGNVTANETVTIQVTNQDGSGVAGVSVMVNEESIGTTGGDGTIEYTIPTDVEELEIEVTKAQQEGEFTVTVE